MYKVCIFVPESHLETVKQAIFEAGAGRYKNYDHCAWQTKGQGQFRPLPGSDPHIGKQGHLEQIEEYKVETVCEEQHLLNVIQALKKSHPYEEPAFDVIKLWKL